MGVGIHCWDWDIREIEVSGLVHLGLMDLGKRQGAIVHIIDGQVFSSINARLRICWKCFNFNLIHATEHATILF